MIEKSANFTRQGVMVVTKARVGVRLRRFREERGLTQAALASALGISPSYVNQLESNQRPMTASVLLKLASVYDADLQQFSAEDADRLLAQLRDVLTDPSVGEQISMAEIRELAASMPAVGRYVIELHRRYRHGRDVNETIMTRIDAGAAELLPGSRPCCRADLRAGRPRHRQRLGRDHRAAGSSARHPGGRSSCWRPG